MQKLARRVLFLCSMVFSTSLTAQLNCGEPVTHLISELQGEGEASPFINNNVRVKGVVVGDFQGENLLGGFYLQEEAADQDDNPFTSEGIFVYEGGAPVLDVSLGQVVVVEATVEEFNGLTELVDVQVAFCDQTEQPVPKIIRDWENTEAFAERFEGMLVHFPDSLFITNLGDVDRFGELELTFSADRQFQYTERNAPGGGAQDYEEEQKRQRLLLDDRKNGSNQRPVYHLENNPLLRAGNWTVDLIGVMDYGFSQYRLRPIEPVIFSGLSFPRGAPLDTGNVRVASFNLENYFNGNGEGGGFSGSRGAQNQAAFNLQTQKLVAAIRGLDASIIGIQEVENDYFQDDLSAIATLVDALNEGAVSGETYAYIAPGPSVGSDVIAVGIIYRSDRVTPIGEPAILSDPPVVFLLDATNRSPLAQTFLVEGEQLTVVVNHFKSKGSSGYDTRFNADPLDDDLGDGQGYWNRMRTRGAEAVVNWVDELTADTPNPRVVILGDLNAYSEEDPVRVFEQAGYTKVLEGTYTIDFMGFWGMLDHILISPALTNEFLAAATWPVNADEADIKAYDSDEQGFVEANAIRSSDHDPLVAAFQIDGPVTSTIKQQQMASWQVVQAPQNPALSSTLEWTIEAAEEASLMLEAFDVGGRLLHRSSQQLLPGRTTVRLEAAPWLHRGVVIWRLSDPNGSFQTGQVMR